MRANKLSFPALMKIKLNMTVWVAAVVILLLINGLADNLFSEEKYQFPDWINKLIEKEETEGVANPPASLSKCIYKGRVVYYRPPRCCDIPGILYDKNGNVICSPDGGLTGRGDGKCPDFSFGNEENGCEVIWKDLRTGGTLRKK
jgi:hypothetical protein